jgi:hypothetical protein
MPTIPTIPKSGTELETLVAFLDYQRAVIIDKCSGLTASQLATRLEPSSLTLPGLAYHLAVVEDDWFQSDFAGRCPRRAMGLGRLGERSGLGVRRRPDWTSMMF